MCLFLNFCCWLNRIFYLLSIWFSYSRLALKQLIQDGLKRSCWGFFVVYLVGSMDVQRSTLVGVLGVCIDICWPNLSCYQCWRW
ncbi:hypothetical protein Hanom_Chr02g00135891 [Helianthus anomalus]